MQPNYLGGYGYNPYQTNYTSYQPKPSETIFSKVNNLDEINTFIVYPNQTAYLLFEGANRLYIKKAGQDGKYIYDDFILIKAEQENSNYVTKKEFSELQNQLQMISQTLASLTTPKGE